jgi:hypothetical protein
MGLVRLIEMLATKPVVKFIQINCLSYAFPMRCFIIIVFELWFKILHWDGPRKLGRIRTERDQSAHSLG